MRVAVTMGTLQIPPTYFAVQHTRLLMGRNEIRTFALAADIRDREIRDSGVVIQDFVRPRSMPFKRRERLIPVALPALSHAVVSFEPDLVHQHFATWSSAAVVASRRAGVPLLVTVHGADVFAALRPLGSVRARARPMLRWHQRNVARAFSAAAQINAVSEYLASQAIRAGADVSTVSVHYQGIDTGYFRPGDREESPSRPPVLLYVGKLSAAKGIDHILRASIELARTHEHVLRIVGAGPLAALVEREAAAHGHIDYRGVLDRAAVRREMQQATTLVLGSQESSGAREAAGLVLLEAQACGTPVVTYASGGTEEMVKNGVTGWVVPEGDRAGLLDAVKAGLTLSTDDHRRMSDAARSFVVAERSLESSATQLEGQYSALVGRHA